MSVLSNQILVSFCLHLRIKKALNVVRRLLEITILSALIVCSVAAQQTSSATQVVTFGIHRVQQAAFASQSSVSVPVTGQQEERNARSVTLLVTGTDQKSKKITAVLNAPLREGSGLEVQMASLNSKNILKKSLTIEATDLTSESRYGQIGIQYFHLGGSIPTDRAVIFTVSD